MINTDTISRMKDGDDYKYRKRKADNTRDLLKVKTQNRLSGLDVYEEEEIISSRISLQRYQ
jgi:hypothetical protein